MTKRSRKAPATRAVPTPPAAATPAAEPNRITIEPQVGPNPEGLLHQARLAHAEADTDAHAALVREFDARQPKPEG